MKLGLRAGPPLQGADKAQHGSVSVMHSAPPIVMSLSAIVGSYLGWRLASKPLYRLSLHHEALQSRRDYQRRVIARRKVRRLLITAAAALMGAIVGYLVLVLVTPIGLEADAPPR